jgi:hypothetical protein
MTKLLCVLLFASFAWSLALCENQTVRDANGRIIARASDTVNGHTLRDAYGKIIGRIADTTNGKIVRDENGRIIARIEGASALRK